MNVQSTITLVVLGDNLVGKSSLITRFETNVFFSNFLPTDHCTFHHSKISVDGVFYNLSIIDTNKDTYDVNEIYIKQAEAFIIMYSISDKQSFNNIQKYLKEVLNIHKQSNVDGSLPPIAIVGNKSDIENERVVSIEEGQELALELSCLFMETSSLNKSNINHLFDVLTREVINKRNLTKTNGECVVV
ncbi:small monomeric GTPase [Entamoeba marina]